MTIAPTLQKYMDEQEIRYDLVPHEPTLTALGSAHADHIPSARLANAIVLSDGGRYTLAFSRLGSSPAVRPQEGTRA